MDRSLSPTECSVFIYLLLQIIFGAVISHPTLGSSAGNLVHGKTRTKLFCQGPMRMVELNWQVCYDRE